LKIKESKRITRRYMKGNSPSSDTSGLCPGGSSFPAGDECHLEFSEKAICGKVKVSIIDQSGRLIRKKDYICSDNRMNQNKYILSGFRLLFP